MDKMRLILSRINEGGMLEDLSREMVLRGPMLRAILDSLVYSGYLEEVKCETSCKECWMRCSIPPASFGIKGYLVTDEGMEFLKDAHTRD